MRIPGLGLKSARLILQARRHGGLRLADLKQMGVVLKRAQYFIICLDRLPLGLHDLKPENIRLALLNNDPITVQTPTQLGLIFYFDRSFEDLLFSLFDAYKQKRFPDQWFLYFLMTIIAWKRKAQKLNRSAKYYVKNYPKRCCV